MHPDIQAILDATPGETCPAIDDVAKHIRIAMGLGSPGAVLGPTARYVRLKQALTALEKVRAENRALRAVARRTRKELEVALGEKA